MKSRNIAYNKKFRKYRLYSSEIKYNNDIYINGKFNQMIRRSYIGK